MHLVLIYFFIYRELIIGTSNTIFKKCLFYLTFKIYMEYNS